MLSFSSVECVGTLGRRQGGVGAARSIWEPPRPAWESCTAACPYSDRTGPVPRACQRGRRCGR